MNEILFKFGWMSPNDPSSSFSVKSDGHDLLFSGFDRNQHPLLVTLHIHPEAAAAAETHILDDLMASHEISYDEAEHPESIWSLRIAEDGIAYDLGGQFSSAEPVETLRLDLLHLADLLQEENCIEEDSVKDLQSLLHTAAFFTSHS